MIHSLFNNLTTNFKTNVYVLRVKLLTVLLLLVSNIYAQYAPQAPLPGHEGIHKADVRFVDWASGCDVQRGWLDIADKSLGQPTIGNHLSPIGIPGSNVLSLGDSGLATLTFDYPILNGPGPDFAVFENAFANPYNDTCAFLELAFVEVSSDGINFFRFPSKSAMQDTLQIGNFDYSDAKYYHNLAGKYINDYGTPFDLADLEEESGININNITHVRIVDVIGSLNPSFASLDSDGNIINESYPTNFPSGGFDLNAVGVINSSKPSSVNTKESVIQVLVFPNPVTHNLYIESKSSEQEMSYSILDAQGRNIIEGVFMQQVWVNMESFANGIYTLYIKDKSDLLIRKITKM